MHGANSCMWVQGLTALRSYREGLPLSINAQLGLCPARVLYATGRRTLAAPAQPSGARMHRISMGKWHGSLKNI